MTTYDTPPAVASSAARWVPKEAVRILDPAVGSGNLVAAVANDASRAWNITGWDIDRNILSCVRDRFAGHKHVKLQLRRGDFVTNSTHCQSFDCVIMNPPYAGKLAERRAIDLYSGRSLPEEAAFLIKGMRALRIGGRLIGILPEGLIASPMSAWFRKQLLTEGRIVAVHELPSRTFTADIRAYIVVIDKLPPRWPVRLLNHSLQKPQRFSLSKVDYAQCERLDFEFHAATNEYAKLVGRTSTTYGWLRLGDLATVIRGQVDSSKDTRDVLHSTNRAGLSWRVDVEKARLFADRPKAFPGDLIMQRVSRSALESLGILSGGAAATLSDCVIAISPYGGVDKYRLLFALRCLFTWPQMRRMLTQGSGAQYVLPRILEDLLVPYALASQYPKLYKAHRTAARRGELGAALRSEGRVHRRLNLHARSV